jgi:predicted ATPase
LFKSENSFIQKLINEEKNNPNKKIEEIISFIEKIIDDEIDLSFESFISFKDFVFVDSDRADIKRLFFDNNNSQFGKILRDFQKLPKDILQKKLEFINHWLVKFQIAEEFILERDQEGIGVRTYLKIDGEKTLMADLGFGVNQLIPLLIKIASVDAGTYMFIEEPESNLHPAFQSRLANLFADAHKQFSINFIIETHSEYMIRKLQTLIADNTNDLKADDVAVYYLYNPNDIPKGEKQVYKLKIRDDGFMDNDFGKGFFDEASSLTMDLLNSKKHN